MPGGRLDIGAFEVNPPLVLSMNVNRDSVAQQSSTVRFSANVSASLAEEEVLLAGAQAPVATSHLQLANYDTTTDTAIFAFTGFPSGSILPDGNYTLDMVQSGIVECAGNMLADVTPIAFFFLNGDANRDRSVNISDFSILASRFNLPGTVSQGDFNYNGTVEIGDFAILASRFNTSVPVAVAISLPARVAGAQLRTWANPFVARHLIDKTEFEGTQALE